MRDASDSRVGYVNLPAVASQGFAYVISITALVSGDGRDASSQAASDATRTLEPALKSPIIAGALVAIMSPLLSAGLFLLGKLL